MKVLDCLIPITLMRNAAKELYSVSKISLCAKKEVPPRTGRLVKVSLDVDGDKVMAIQSDGTSRVLVPNCVFDLKDPAVQVLNDTDASVFFSTKGLCAWICS